MTAEILEAVEQLRDMPDANDVLTAVVEQLTTEQLRADSNEKRLLKLERMHSQVVANLQAEIRALEIKVQEQKSMLNSHNQNEFAEPEPK